MEVKLWYVAGAPPWRHQPQAIATKCLLRSLRNATSLGDDSTTLLSRSRALYASSNAHLIPNAHLRIIAFSSLASVTST